MVFLRTFIFLFYLSLSFTSSGEENFVEKIRDDGKWDKIYEMDGIIVYGQKIVNSDIMALKADGILESPIEKLLTLLRDVEGQATWSHNLILKKTIEDLSDIEVITYDLHDLPWPVYDRDLVVSNKLYLDRKRGYLTIGSRSVTHPSSPIQSDKVRAQLTFGTIAFRPVDSSHTAAKLFIHIDPKGLIPSFVVNELQKRWPYRYLKSMELASKKIEPHMNKTVSSMLVELKNLLKSKKFDAP